MYERLGPPHKPYRHRRSRLLPGGSFYQGPLRHGLPPGHVRGERLGVIPQRCGARLGLERLPLRPDPALSPASSDATPPFSTYIHKTLQLLVEANNLGTAGSTPYPTSKRYLTPSRTRCGAPRRAPANPMRAAQPEGGALLHPPEGAPRGHPPEEGDQKIYALLYCP